VAHTGIGWFVELVAQIQERVMEGGLGTEAFVHRIHEWISDATGGRVELGRWGRRRGGHDWVGGR